MKRAVKYDIENWRVTHKDGTRIVYRPGAKTFLVRFGWTAVAAFVVWGMHVTMGRSPLGDLEWIYRGLLGLLAGLGVAVPLSCLWNRVTIALDGRGNIVVMRMGAMAPSRRAWPIQSYGSIFIMAKEAMVRSNRQWRQIGWRWHVMLMGQSVTSADGTFTPPPGGSSHTQVEFIIDRQKHRPTGNTMSIRTAELVTALQGLTGLSYRPVQVVEFRSAPGLRAGPVAGRTVSTGGPTVTRHTFNSLDEMPPELRARAEQMMAAAKEQDIPPGEPIQFTNQRIMVRDAQGNERTYNSLDEMPPAERARYEQMLRRHGGRVQ